MVIVGTPVRTTVLVRPVQGTELVGNESTIAGNADPYRWVTAHVDTVDRGNTAGVWPHRCARGSSPRGRRSFS